MNKAFMKTLTAKFTVFGILTSIGLFLSGLFVMFTSDQGNFVWTLVLGASILVGSLTSYIFPKAKSNSWFFWAAACLGLITLLVIFDMYDERANEYPSSLSSGNGLLIDGINQIIYVFLVPLIYSVFISLMSINILKKRRS